MEKKRTKNSVRELAPQAHIYFACVVAMNPFSFTVPDCIVVLRSRAVTANIRKKIIKYVLEAYVRQCRPRWQIV